MYQEMVIINLVIMGSIHLLCLVEVSYVYAKGFINDNNCDYSKCKIVLLSDFLQIDDIVISSTVIFSFIMLLSLAFPIMYVLVVFWTIMVISRKLTRTIKGGKQ